ncbi:MAG: VanZ family protein [Lachnospiraceae bacterium]|nr:VanZ family protein [Lachnospiraceae bacterium]
MKNEKEKGRILAYIVMGIYLLLLCWLILFKLADNINKIPSMRGINLIPFYYDQLARTQFHLREVLYNIVVFVPAGFYFTFLGKKKVVFGIAFSALLSLCFEILQWIFALGASDITDLITNTAGGIIGSVVFFITNKLFKGHEILIVSIIGAIIEALLLGLLIVLFVSNIK